MKKKTVSKKSTDDIDEITMRLLEVEVTKTELEPVEDMKLEKIKILKEPQSVKLQPMKIERKKIESVKPQIQEQEMPQRIQLRKVKTGQKQQIEEMKIPTVLLKSRINRVQYPPEVSFLEISELNVEPQNGQLSRTEEVEPEKKKKKKQKSFVEPEEEISELEKLESFEEEIKEKIVPEKQPAKKYERPNIQKEPLEEENDVKIKKTKGKDQMSNI